MANKYSGTQTEKNLQAAFAGESQARNKYTYFASKAKKEGFEQIATFFLETAQVFAKSEVKVWECRNCGHIVVGTSASEVCPVCNHPQAYFELHKENFKSSGVRHRSVTLWTEKKTRRPIITCRSPLISRSKQSFGFSVRNLVKQSHGCRCIVGHELCVSVTVLVGCDDDVLVSLLGKLGLKLCDQF
jgi:Rubrerythrin